MERSQEHLAGGAPQQSRLSQRFYEVKERLRTPIQNAKVYKPLILILICTCLQHFSGFTFTKKYLLQILYQSDKKEDCHEAAIKSDNGLQQDQNNTIYYFAIVISFLRFSANILMSYLLERFRVRFFFFVSVFTTSGSLGTLGILLHPTATQDILSPETNKLLRLLSLSIHVFAVQLGLQTITGLLTDCLLPSSSKPLLKGMCRSFQSLSLFLFVLVMELLPKSWQFWSMAAVLLLSSPALYICLPELSKLGKDAGELYFQPLQHIFY